MKNSFTLTKKTTGLCILIFFAVLTLVVRFQSFSIRIIDWDESLYYLWAKDLFLGYLPYVNIIENKPVGIGFVYAGAMLAFGKSMFSVRILAWLSVTCSSYLLYRIGNILHPCSRFIGILAGIFYSVYSYFNLGISANTEIFFIFFTLLAFYLFFNSKNFLSEPNPKIYKTFFWIGLFFGLAFLIKYVVVFDIISLFIITLSCIYINTKENIKIEPAHIVKLFSCLMLGLILPQFFIVILYAIKGQLHTFIYTNIFTLKYASSIPFSFKNMLENLIVNLSFYKILLISLFLFIFFEDFSRETKFNLLCILIWNLVVLLELLFCLTHCWNHYYIQELPPLCLLSSILIVESFKLLKITIRVKYILFSFLLISLFYSSYCGILNPPNPICSLNNKGTFRLINNKIEPFYNDREYVVADYINKKIGTGKYIFILSEDYVIYNMTKSKHTSRYVMPYMIMDSSLNSIIDKEKEIKKIMAQHPAYVILPNNKGSIWSKGIYSMFSSNTLVYKLMCKYLQRDYIFETKFGDDLLYRRKYSL